MQHTQRGGACKEEDPFGGVNHLGAKVGAIEPPSLEEHRAGRVLAAHQRGVARAVSGDAQCARRDQGGGSSEQQRGGAEKASKVASYAPAVAKVGKVGAVGRPRGISLETSAGVVAGLIARVGQRKGARARSRSKIGATGSIEAAADEGADEESGFEAKWHGQRGRAVDAPPKSRGQRKDPAHG